jgi:hypothetical protein
MAALRSVAVRVDRGQVEVALMAFLWLRGAGGV